MINKGHKGRDTKSRLTRTQSKGDKVTTYKGKDAELRLTKERTQSHDYKGHKVAINKGHKGKDTKLRLTKERTQSHE